MGPSKEALALADFLIARYGLTADRYQLAYAIMEHEEKAMRAEPEQVGEVQVSDFDIDDVRELFEKHAKGRDLTPDTWGLSSYVDPYVDNDWNEWAAAWEAFASRQSGDA